MLQGCHWVDSGAFDVYSLPSGVMVLPWAASISFMSCAVVSVEFMRALDATVRTVVSVG